MQPIREAAGTSGQTASGGIYVVRVDGAGRTVSVNRVLLEALGRREDEVAGRPFRETLVLPDAWQALVRLLETARGPEPVPFSAIRFRAAGGQAFPLDGHAVPLAGKGGDPDGFVLFGPVPGPQAGRRGPEQVEQQLAERLLSFMPAGGPGLEDVLRPCLAAALEGAGMDCGGVYLLDEATGGAALVCHQGLPESFARSAASYGADSANLHLVRDGRALYADHPALAERYRVPLTDEEKAAGLRALAVLPLRYEGRVIGCLNVASRSLSEVPPDARALLETVASFTALALARWKAERALEDTRDRLAATLDALPDLLFELDRDGTIREHKAYDPAQLHMPPEAFLGKRVGELLPPEAARVIQDALEEAARCGTVRGVGYSLETPKGLRWFELSLAFRPDKRTGGRFVGLVRDVTERRRLQEEVWRKQRLESLGVLAGGIAHDFNNILTPILAGISGTVRHAGLDPESREMLRTAEQASLRARGLAQRLLVFARGGHPVKKPASLAPLLKETARIALSGSRARWALSLPEDVRNVEVDPVQIQQVFQNLLLNAEQAMPGGGEISIRAENVADARDADLPGREAGYVRVSVSDQGAGIPAADLGSIFEPFFSTRKGGSGLGLSVAHSIVERHGGRIRVESRPGAGTVFHVLLPATREAVPREGEAPETAGRGRAPGRVLLVDDDPGVRKSARVLLRRLGWDVQAAENGEEGVWAFGKAQEGGRPFDVVVMDLTLPGGMSGTDAAREILRKDPGARIIVSSGYTDDPAMSEPGRFGFAAALQKPYRAAEFAGVLAEAAPPGTGARARGPARGSADGPGAGAGPLPPDRPEAPDAAGEPSPGSADNFRTFIETLDDLVVIARPDGRILYTNPAAQKRLGFDGEEMRAKRVLDLHPADLRDEARAVFLAMGRGEQGLCPLPLAARDGARIPVETRVWHGRWDGREVIFGISKDLSKEQEALQKFERFFRSNPALMAVSSVPERRFTDVNDAFVRVLGYARQEVLGRTSRELGLFVHPEKQLAVERAVRERGFLREMELDVRTRDGGVRRGLFSGDVIRSQGRSLFLTVMIDITERKKAEQERERLIVELREALDKILTLTGLIPICASCKNVRDDEGYWHSVEAYIRQRTDAEFSHGLCPACLKRLYPEQVRELTRSGRLRYRRNPPDED